MTSADTTQEPTPPTMTGDPAHQRSHLTAEEAFESCNGYDEIAIGKRFGTNPTQLASDQPTMFLRALVFVFERRNGRTDDEAYEYAMTAPLGQAYGYFEPEPEEESDDPLAEFRTGSLVPTLGPVGKDAPRHARQPAN